MNYYGTEKHKEDMKKLDEQIFSKIKFDKPEREKELESACIIHHADGNTYFVFDEDLYGYSVLNLDTLQSMHYIPAESHGKYPEEFKETFIWCDCFYNSQNDLLAVDGCFWACPGDVIVLDFKDPLTAVEPKDWISIYSRCEYDDLDLDDIEFDRWDADTLVCKATGAEPVVFNLEGKCRIRFI